MSDKFSGYFFIFKQNLTKIHRLNYNFTVDVRKMEIRIYKKLSTFSTQFSTKLLALEFKGFLRVSTNNPHGSSCGFQLFIKLKSGYITTCF